MVNEEVIVDSMIAVGKLNFSASTRKFILHSTFIYLMIELLFSSHVKSWLSSH